MLTEIACCENFLEELDEAKRTYQFRLWAYVLMANHVHLLIYPIQPKYDISKILQSIKGKTSTRYRKYLIETDPKK